MGGSYDLFVGIDYSGAETAESRLKGLQVFAAEPVTEPHAVRPPVPARNWTRQEIAHWLRERIQTGMRSARWLEETSRNGLLDRYFNPPLTLPERRMAALEGWILGIG